jgi:hypothetical protein
LFAIFIFDTSVFDPLMILQLLRCMNTQTQQFRSKSNQDLPRILEARPKLSEPLEASFFGGWRLHQWTIMNGFHGPE